ncbi:hypothetical protein [Bradyrhizobium sp.]
MKLATREIVSTTVRLREAKGYFFRPGVLNRIVAEIEHKVAALVPRERENIERVIDIYEECIRAEEVHPQCIRAQRYFASIAVSGWRDWAKIAGEMI